MSTFPQEGQHVVYFKRDRRATRNHWRGVVIAVNQRYERFTVKWGPNDLVGNDPIEVSYTPNAFTNYPVSRANEVFDNWRGSLYPYPGYIWIDDQQKEHHGMNLHNAASLIRDDVTTVDVTHDKQKGRYTYKVLRSLADDLQAGDNVVVKNSHGMVIGTVIRVHQEPKIDVNADFEYRWVFQKVRTERIDQLEHEDARLVEHLQRHQQQNTRAQVLAAFGVSNGQQLLEDIRKEDTHDGVG